MYFHGQYINFHCYYIYSRSLYFHGQCIFMTKIFMANVFSRPTCFHGYCICICSQYFHGQYFQGQNNEMPNIFSRPIILSWPNFSWIIDFRTYSQCPIFSWPTFSCMADIFSWPIHFHKYPMPNIFMANIFIYGQYTFLAKVLPYIANAQYFHG